MRVAYISGYGAIKEKEMTFWNYNLHASFKANSQGYKENTPMNNELLITAACLVFRCLAKKMKCPPPLVEFFSTVLKNITEKKLLSGLIVNCRQALLK